MTPANKRIIAAVGFLLTWAGGLCETTRGVDFAGGTGEPNDPYKIATADQLLAIDDDPNLTAAHYVLATSIDLAGREFSSPVFTYFSGCLDGNGTTIRNLRFIGGGIGGLFYTITATGKVKNLGVVDVYVQSSGPCGGLAFLHCGSIDNCYSTGQVIGWGPQAGGLVGNNMGGTISNSYSGASVAGVGSVGGLAGASSGSLSFCHSTGEVGGDTNVGGLVGTNKGEVTSSYSLATVTGALQKTGGLVGSNSGTIASCYAGATVTGRDRVGGFAGENNGSISCCYSTGTVTGWEVVGGLVADNKGEISSSYSVTTVDNTWGWYVGGLAGLGDAPDNCYCLDASDGGGPDNDIGTALTDAQMKEQASFVGWDFWGTAEDGQDDLWFMPQNAYPVLPWQTEITGLYRIPDVAGLSLKEARAALTAAGFAPGEVSYDYNLTVSAGCVVSMTPRGLAPAGTRVDLVVSTDGTYSWATNAGDGTPADPYRIETASQLESLIDHPELWDKCFVLVADVDMSGRTYSMALIAPDANDTKSGYQGTPFSGVLDGRGHVIRNLTIIGQGPPFGLVTKPKSTRNYVGLFGMVAPEGRIEKVHLIDAYVENRSGLSRYVGVLAGFNAGMISGCSATGFISGGSGDGLVGDNIGTVTGSTANLTREI